MPYSAVLECSYRRIPRSAMFSAAAIVFLIVLGLALIVVASTRRNQPCW